MEDVALMHVETLIIGAGPAGLTTGYELTKAGHSALIVERDPDYVGGISRTVVYKGYRFDIGGHRFFSKSAEIEALWTELMGDELLERPRSSRIFYKRKLFDYPLRAMDALIKLGPIEAVRCVASYGLGAPVSHPSGTQFRAMGRQQFRPPPVRDLLQGPTPRRSGAWIAPRSPPTGLPNASRASTFMPPSFRALARRKPKQGRQVRRHQDADQFVPLSPPRPRPDVGTRPRPHSRTGRQRS